MKKLHDFQNFLAGLLDTKPVSMIISILCAVLIWFSVSVTVYQTTHVRFYQIPLTIDLTGTPAEANGLSSVSCDVEMVTVELEGNRAQIGRLTQEDLKANIITGNTDTIGEFSFEISIETDKNISFVSTISPDYATVKLDRIETRTYDVTASVPNVQATSGHAMDKNDILFEPAQIEITGPSTQLDKISRVEAYSDKSLKIDSLYSLYTSEIRLYSPEGAILDTDDLEIPNTNFQITIPVLTQKELKLTYDIFNAPSNFNLDWLKEHLQLSEDTITLASQTNTAFAELDEWPLGSVKLNDIGLTSENYFTVELGEEFINQSGFQQVRLTLNNENEELTSREFQVSDNNISVVNVPKNYDINIITKNLSVTVIGTEEDLDALSTQDIIVTVDLLNNYNITQSTSVNADATISFYGEESRIWAVGAYKVAVELTEKPTETTVAETISPTDSETTTETESGS
ncbi:MAG: hypothetical protein K2G25_01500 [Oscillospiraceae bacterium]|nr:hypothetical protein [Oscillospiraceae bacterium]